MQNFIVNALKSHPIARSLISPKRHFGKSQPLLGRCSGGKCDQKQEKPDPKKCAPPPPPPPPENTKEPTKAAVVLSGCGHLDGSCVYEATAVAVHLSRFGVMPCFFAPRGAQADVINHQTACPMNEERCAIREGARIARGKISDLADLRYCDVSCVIFPGGFGVTKTLTTFDKDRASCSIDAEVMRVLEEFHDARKPMGFICIAAILPARLFPLVKITLGMKGKPELWPYQFAIDCACEMGAEVETRDVDGFSFDKQHMVFSTPAFMFNGTGAQVYDGIGNMIQNMCKYLE